MGFRLEVWLFHGQVGIRSIPGQRQVPSSWSAAPRHHRVPKFSRFSPWRLPDMSQLEIDQHMWASHAEEVLWYYAGHMQQQSACGQVR